MHVQVDALDKSFGPTRVLKECSLGIDRGEVVTLLGPSGCGKTTLLRCIAGFYIPEQGSVVIGERDMTLVPPHRRDVGMIFQSYALFPHLSVRRNVEYGLSVRKVARSERDDRVAKALDLVSLGDLADRYPSQLSGGQQQRVAIARVLVLEPTVLLLDEPFNALDAKLRYSMQVELRKLVKTLGITTIFVTHDQSEALTLSDRVAVMREGEIEQVAAPLGVYDTPASDYVADFIGSANALAGEAHAGRPRDRPRGDARRADGGPGGRDRAAREPARGARRRRYRRRLARAGRVRARPRRHRRVRDRGAGARSGEGARAPSRE